MANAIGPPLQGNCRLFATRYQPLNGVIAGGMGHKAITLFNEHKINAYVGAPLKPAKELVEDFLADRLALTANYCNHDHTCGQ